MKKISVIFMFIFLIFLSGCSGYASNSDKKDIKETVDKVLSYDITYDDSLSNYINEKNFYISNYRFFYTLFLGDLSAFEYNSQVQSIKKNGKEYIACFLLNLKAEGQLIYEGEEDEENDEGHRASAEGIDVPIKVVLKKTDNGFYIKSVTEYDTLDIAKEKNDGFK